MRTFFGDRSIPALQVGCMVGVVIVVVVFCKMLNLTKHSLSVAFFMGKQLQLSA